MGMDPFKFFSLYHRSLPNATVSAQFGKKAQEKATPQKEAVKQTAETPISL